MALCGAWRTVVAATLCAFMLFGPAAGQTADDETLADIRRQLFDLFATMERLRLQLRPSDRATVGDGSGLPSDVSVQRIDELELELRRAIDKIERLEFRIIRIAEDGSRQIKDLEFLLTELGGGDLSSVGEGVPLGNEGGTESSEFGSPSGEQAEFDRAMAAFSAADYAEADRLFAEFTRVHAFSELNVDAHFHRGEALAGIGDSAGAAKAYLDSYRLDKEGETAPRALLGLGRSLSAVGRSAEACRLLQEILVAFPDSAEAGTASAEFDSLGCN